MSSFDLSIIVPVYRTPEVLLRRCIASILQQRGLSLELILVNDASPDNCPLILAEYAAQDSRIRVLHRSENGRAGKARNDGLELAAGEYIWFVDADDMILPGAAANLLQVARAQAADILMFSWSENDEQGRLLRQVKKKTAKVDFTRSEERAAYFRNLQYALWNKIFRRDNLGSLRFQSFPANIGEDTLYNVAALCRCQKLSCCSLIGYQYTVFSGSASHRSNKGMPYLQTLQSSQQAINEELIQAYGQEGQRYAACLASKRFVTGCEWIAENPEQQTRQELWAYWRQGHDSLFAPGAQGKHTSGRLFKSLCRYLTPGPAARIMRIMLAMQRRLFN